jgi:hypothetical protein
MSKIIFCTRQPIGMYKFIINSIKINLEKKISSKTKFIFPKRKFISFSLFFFFIKNLLFFNFFLKRKLLYVTYKDCDIGKHVLARVFRDVSSYKNMFILYKNLFKYLYIGCNIIDEAYKVSNKISAAYIDHSGYLNGLYFRVFALKKKIVYTNNYPRGIFYIDFRKKKNSYLSANENALKLFKSKNFYKKSYEKNKILVSKIINNPRIVPWMKTTKFNNLKNIPIDTKAVKHVVYTHSFVDGQLWFGNDGFVTLKEWLIFTLDKLSKLETKSIIKAHPNFYDKSIGIISELDKKIFNELKNKYQSDKIFFIDQPTKNKYLLKVLDKKTILISHHGTSLLEGLFSGFKCVSSTSTFWSSSLVLTNQWSSIEEYNKILEKSYKQLYFPNKADLSCVSSQLFLDPVSEYGSKFWEKIIVNNLSKLERNKLYQSIDFNPKIKQLDNISKEVAKSIPEIQI